MSPHRRQHNKKEYGNRLIILMTIILLLGLIVVYRLVRLEIIDYDYYIALASDQHQVFNQLMPERGRIYFQDKDAGNKSGLYPIATNKDFGLVYAVPSLVSDPAGEAEKLFELFDREQVAKDVDKALETDEQFAPLKEPDAMVAKDREALEKFRDIKRELDVKEKGDAIIAAYVEKLSKHNDPYEPIKKKVDEDYLARLDQLELAGIEYVKEKHRYYPEGEVGAQMIGFVGYDGDTEVGRYGLEGFFDEELRGVRGTLRAERSARGGTIIINDQEFNSPKNGSDLVLTIDRVIQFEVCDQLKKGVEQYAADSGTIIVMEPFTGAILAMCSFPEYDPNRYSEVEDINDYNNPAIFRAFEPGSIFKVITLSAGLDQGKITPKTTYEDKGWVMVEGWPKPIKNSDYETHGGHGVVDMVTVLEASLNTGSIFVEQKTGATEFADYVKKFGFGEKTGIELETEGLTNIQSLNRKTIRPVEAATASFGQGITATPIQLIAAFSAVANGGILMKPYLVDEIIAADGSSQKTQPVQIRRVIEDKTAYMMAGMMVNVVDLGHAKYAAVPGYYVAGKTGTAQVADKERGGYYADQTIQSFIGFAPVEEPKFVILVKLENPKNVEFAANSAAPLFGKLASFILNYYQVPKER